MRHPDWKGFGQHFDFTQWQVGAVRTESWHYEWLSSGFNIFTLVHMEKLRYIPVFTLVSSHVWRCTLWKVFWPLQRTSWLRCLQICWPKSSGLCRFLLSLQTRWLWGTSSCLCTSWIFLHFFGVHVWSDSGYTLTHGALVQASGRQNTLGYGFTKSFWYSALCLVRGYAHASVYGASHGFHFLRKYGLRTFILTGVFVGASVNLLAEDFRTVLTPSVPADPVLQVWSDS